METNTITDIKQLIKFVSLYLRKSRGDLDNDLEKHKKTLMDMCITNNWKYVLYEEVESGATIALRPIFQKLLQDIEDNIYDAVCVVDIDRLGRGDLGDTDRINKAFANSGTLIVTPEQIYNLDNENDEFNIEVKNFVARIEYKQIVKRLTQGKKVGARMGQWTNGKPPYPYEYERYKDKYNKKGIVVNDEKLAIYRRIIESYLYDKKSTSTISYELNKEKITTAKGNQWSNVTINRLLVDETHLGKIISNKTKGNGHVKKKGIAKPFKKISKSNWVIVENCHTPVKTQEEHDKILMIMSKNNNLLHRDYKASPKKLPLTGLFRCSKCGRTLSVYMTKNRKYNEAIKPCWYKNSVGDKCGNSGMYITDEIYRTIENMINKHEKEIENAIINKDNHEVYTIQEKIKNKRKDIKKKEIALTKVMEAYEADVYTLSEFKVRKTDLNNEIETIKEEIEILERNLNSNDQNTNKYRLNKIKEYRKKMENRDNLSNEELNDNYKEIIDHILWLKEGDNIEFEVVFK